MRAWRRQGSVCSQSCIPPLQPTQTLIRSLQSIPFTRICKKPGSWESSQGRGLRIYIQKKNHWEKNHWICLQWWSWNPAYQLSTKAFGNTFSKQDVARSLPANYTLWCWRYRSSMLNRQTRTNLHWNRRPACSLDQLRKSRALLVATCTGLGGKSRALRS